LDAFTSCTPSIFGLVGVISLVLGALFLLTMHPAFLDAKQQSAIVKIVEIIVFLPAIPGGLLMFLGMEWFCLEVDTSRKSVRLLRAFMLLCTMPFGQVRLLLLNLPAANGMGRNENSLRVSPATSASAA
jgi:hypothetical protein